MNILHSAENERTRLERNKMLPGS